MLDYMIIYPRGDRSRLCVAQVRDYQRDEWDLASRMTFAEREDAEIYMVELAERHGLDYETEILPKNHRYLD